MRFGKRGPQATDARRRGAYRPAGENLEGRLLLAVDLGGTSPPNLPFIATAPVGIDMAGTQAGGGAGFSVADIGDVTNDGYDDFLISAPTVGQQGGVIVPASGVPTVYLVFGSRTVTGRAISDWLTNTTNQRVGDLSQLGNSAAGQQNPITGVAGFPFDGIKIITSQTTGSQLGASVAEAGVINGQRAFLIGAPGARDVNGNNPGTGRAYLIYGGTGLLSVSNGQLDLDNPLQNSGVTVLTFVGTNLPGARIGRSVAGVGDVITDGINDIAIGAPGATVNGLSSSGAAFLVSGAALPAATSTINLSAVGVTGGVPGVVFAGQTAGEEAGFSVSAAGNVDGDLTSANQPVSDLLIGAPNILGAGPGSAYLVYGAINLPAQGVNGVISLNRVGATGNTGVRGARVVGANNGDQTGYAVSTAGDFNADGLADILIGSPGYQNSRGRVDLFYGQAFSGTPLQGTYTLDSLAAGTSVLSMIGGATGDLAGYAVSEVGRINATPGNPILIGAPGFFNNAGTAYLVPSNPGQLEGRFSLGAAESQPLAATQFTLTTPAGTTAPFFGASVSGRLTQSGQTRTGDNDLIGDFIIGAPGYVVNTPGRNLAGGGFIVEGFFVPLQVPVNNNITTQIGVGQPFGPFTNIDPTNPADLDIYVFSNSTITPAFDPVAQIDPTTVVVNGVAYRNATIRKDPVDENKDGVPDAIITINPRANLNLRTSTTSLTITGRTRATGANANRRWSGTATISVSGGGGGGGGGGGRGFAALPPGTVLPTAFIPPFGPDRYVPPISALSRLGSYKPIPYRVAIHQYLPDKAWAARIENFYNPKHVVHQFGSRHDDRAGRTSTLGRDVFTRGKYKPGRVFEFTHREHVIPATLQTTRWGGQPRPWYQAHPKG